MDAARLAGIIAAINAHTASEPAAKVSAIGSSLANFIGLPTDTCADMNGYSRVLEITGALVDAAGEFV